MYFYEKKKVKVRAVPLIIAIISGLIALASLGLSAYNSHYSRNVASAKKATLSYSSSKANPVRLDMSPAKGVLYYGLMQDSGKVGTTYIFDYKKNTASSYSRLATHTFPKNDKYYGDWKIGTTNGKFSYNFKITKTNYTGTNSKVHFDLGLD